MNTEDKSEEINEMIPEEQEELDLESDDNEHQEEIKSIEEQLQEDLNKEKDKFLRLFAEFENYKKRTSKERMDLFKTAGQEVIVALLPIMDDFDRALKEISKSTDKELFKGVDLISNKFKETLKSKGLQEITTKEGDAFDA